MTIEQLLANVRVGTCGIEEAAQQIGQYVSDALAERVEAENLLDHFACTAAIGRDVHGNIADSAARAVMGEHPPRWDDLAPSKNVAVLQWWATAEARIRYVKAQAMVEARKL